MNQHDFFINNVRDARPIDDTLLCVLNHSRVFRFIQVFARWDVVADPNTSPPKSEAGLTELFGEIRSTVDTETQIVKAVFPNPSVVMQVFLQRVFAQSVSDTQHLKPLR